MGLDKWKSRSSIGCTTEQEDSTSMTLGKSFNLDLHNLAVELKEEKGIVAGGGRVKQTYEEELLQSLREFEDEDIIVYAENAATTAAADIL